MLILSVCQSVVCWYLQCWNLDLKSSPVLNHMVVFLSLVWKSLNSSFYISHCEQQENIETPISKEFIWYMYFRLHDESHVFPTMSIPAFLVCKRMHENLNCVVPWNHSTNKCQPCILLRSGGWGGQHNHVRGFHCHHSLDKFH